MSLLSRRIGTTCPGQFSVDTTRKKNALTTHSGMVNMNGVPINESPQPAAASNGRQRMGHVHKKALFREYIHGAFTQQSARPGVSNLWIQTLG